MAISEPLTTYLELRQSSDDGEAAAGLSHTAGGLFLLHVLELAAYGEPRGGVTLVHDAGDHGGRYLEVARELAAVNCAVALPDLRGHGKSEGARGDSAGLREVHRDLDAVQDHLAYRLPVAPKVLIGVGLGALYAANYALEQPGRIAALVLLSPRWRASFEIPPSPSGLSRLFKKRALDALGRVGNDPKRLFSDVAAQLAWSSDPLVHDVITVRAAERAAELAREVERRLRDCAVPTLIVHGSLDPFCDAALCAQFASPRCQVINVPGASHGVLHDVGRIETIGTVRTFIERAFS